MAIVLMTAVIAAIALALPNPAYPILPRDLPQPFGLDQGTDFRDLEFKIYAEPKCKGERAGDYTGSYGFYEAYQMQSYHLSRDLYDNETLEFYSGSGPGMEVDNTIDHSLDGHYTASCWVYDTTAGVNATADDKAVEQGGHLGLGGMEGCHTLNKNEWCAVISVH